MTDPRERREAVVLPTQGHYIGAVNRWPRMAVIPRIEALCKHKHAGTDAGWRAAQRCAVRLLGESTHD